MNETYKNNENNMVQGNQLTSLPKNVRQIGDVKDGEKIYVEDYVYTYLHQFAEEEKTSEQIAFLIGNEYNYNEEVILLINGAIKAQYLEKENGNLHITEKTWTDVYENIEAYFSENKVLGWMYTQPGYGILLTSFLSEHHCIHFKDPRHILYIVDPLEKEDTFFAKRNGILAEKKGYFIYYDKNKKMHNYMMEHKVRKDREKPKEDVIVNSYRKIEQVRKDDLYQKKYVNMLSIVCGGLVFICLTMGIGLLSNIEKLSELQTAMNTITQEYIDIKQELNKKEGIIKQETEQIINDIEQETDKTIKIEETGNETQTNTEDTNNEILPKDTNEIDPSQGVVEQVAQGQDEVEGGGESVKEYETFEIETFYYTIKSGDNIISISKKFYKSEAQVPVILELNGIDNPHKIYVGQKILLPKP